MTYTVYLSDVSYFSGKLEAALRVKRIPYRRVTVTPEILLDEVLPQTGWMKVPALRRDDGEWRCDTTPLLDWLEQAHPDRPLMPVSPVARFLSRLVEDYCDEWQWRPAMLWRWGWDDNARYLGARLGVELSRGTPHPAWLMGLYFRRRQQRVFVRGDGVRPHNRDAVASLYPRALQWLDALLAERPFLLGAQPSRVDIAWMGPMFRHYAQDPRPAALMAATAPRVWAWVSRVWNSGVRPMAAALAGDAFDDPAWQPVLADIGQAYLPYLLDNHHALACGARHFSGVYGGIAYPQLPVVAYRARCLLSLQQAFAALPSAARATVAARLADRGAVAALATPLPPVPGLSPVDLAPARPIARLTPVQRLRAYFGGTPWDRFQKT